MFLDLLAEEYSKWSQVPVFGLHVSDSGVLFHECIMHLAFTPVTVQFMVIPMDKAMNNFHHHPCEGWPECIFKVELHPQWGPRLC